MKTTERVWVFVNILKCIPIVLAVALPLWGADWWIGVDVEGSPVINDRGSFGQGAEVIFVDEPFRIRLTISTTEVHPRVTPPVNAWWRQVELVVTPSENDPYILPLDDARVDQSYRRKELRAEADDSLLTLPRGERDMVWIDLDLWPVGDYSIQARLTNRGQVYLTAPHVVHVRKGNETLDVRRVWLRHAIRGAEFPEAKTHLLELARIEPSSWSHWQLLGDLSIGKVEASETLSYYEKAETLVRERIKSSGSLPALQKLIKQLTLYKRLLPAMNESGGRYVLRAKGLGPDKEYVWYDRVESRELGPVNLDDPKPPRRPEH